MQRGVLCIMVSSWVFWGLLAVLSCVWVISSYLINAAYFKYIKPRECCHYHAGAVIFITARFWGIFLWEIQSLYTHPSFHIMVKFSLLSLRPIEMFCMKTRESYILFLLSWSLNIDPVHRFTVSDYLAHLFMGGIDVVIVCGYGSPVSMCKLRWGEFVHLWLLLCVVTPVNVCVWESVIVFVTALSVHSAAWCRTPLPLHGLPCHELVFTVLPGSLLSTWHETKGSHSQGPQATQVRSSPPDLH